jgi:hypothetical protein
MMVQTATPYRHSIAPLGAVDDGRSVPTAG